MWRCFLCLLIIHLRAATDSISIFCDLIRTQYSTIHMRDEDLFPLLVWKKGGKDLFLEELSMNVSFYF